MNLKELPAVPEIFEEEFHELKHMFNEDAEQCGCHCPIDECKDSQCGIIGLENYLARAYWLGYQKANEAHTHETEEGASQ